MNIIFGSSSPTLTVGALCQHDTCRRPFDEIAIAQPVQNLRLNVHLSDAGKPIVVLGPSERMFQYDMRVWVSNEEFVEDTFHDIPANAFTVGCSQRSFVSGSPDFYWVARDISDLIDGSEEVYVPGISYRLSSDGHFQLDREHFAALHFIAFDDIGGRNLIERFSGLQLSWLLEIAPGVVQGGVIFDTPIEDFDVAMGLLRSAVGAGLCSEGGALPPGYWARLPRGPSVDERHAGRILDWNPQTRWSVEEFRDEFGLCADSDVNPLLAEYDFDV